MGATAAPAGQVAQRARANMAQCELVVRRPRGYVVPVVTRPSEPVPQICSESRQVRAEGGELVQNLRRRQVPAAGPPAAVPIAGALGGAGRQRRLCHASNSSGRAAQPRRDTRTVILAVTAGRGHRRAGRMRRQFGGAVVARLVLDNIVAGSQQTGVRKQTTSTAADWCSAVIAIWRQADLCSVRMRAPQGPTARGRSRPTCLACRG